MSSSQNIRVVCRFRPQNKIELSKGNAVCVDFIDKTQVKHLGTSDKPFVFDRIFDDSSTQKEVYEYAAEPVIEDVLQGFNGTILAYGQTSCGKTHTMEGPAIEDVNLKGIIPRMVSTIFQGVQKAAQSIEFFVKCSYVEIYLEKIRDLFDTTKDNLPIREDKGRGIWIDGATEVYVGSEREVLDLLKDGATNRSVAATKMNLESSRSHSVFILTLTQRNSQDLSSKTGKLFMVDLAGSEKISKTGAEGQTLEEAKNINKSLTTLGMVINSLTDGKSTHVPYRDSKLTRILQESLGGNAKTTLILCASMSTFNESETLGTLRFGQRAKSIKNKAMVNRERSVQELTKLLGAAEAEIERCRIQIARMDEELRQLRGPSTGTAVVLTHTKASDEMGVPELQEKCDALEVKSRMDVERITELQANEEDLTNRLQEAKEELTSKEDTCVALRQEFEDMMTLHTPILREHEMCGAKIAELRMSYERAQLEITSLVEEKDNLQVQVVTLQEKLDNVHRRLATGTMSSLEKSPGFTAQPSPANEASAEAKNEEEELLRVRMQQLESQNLDRQHEMERMQDAHRHQLAQLQLAEQSQQWHNENEKLLKEEVAMLKEHQGKQMKDFDNLKAILLKDLQKKCEKIIELEICLDESRDQYAQLEKRLQPGAGDKNLKRECMHLTRKLEQVTSVYEQLLTLMQRTKEENVRMKKDGLEKDEKIQVIELLLQDSRDQVSTYRSKADKLERDLKIAREASPFSFNDALGSSLNRNQSLRSGGNRVVRPIRGGGGISDLPTSIQVIDTSNADDIRRMSARKLAAATGGEYAEPWRSGERRTTPDGRRQSDTSLLVGQNVSPWRARAAALSSVSPKPVSRNSSAKWSKLLNLFGAIDTDQDQPKAPNTQTSPSA
mmetsp:Transcript_43968/g.71532  ORF Transcript_43968/g.71532 Transcript_43968/m.71532 type:complete len:897 (+) Transcript_43968:81-2771(+)